MKMLRWMGCCLAAVLPLASWAAVRVESVDGQPIVRVTHGAVAAWRPAPDQLALVVRGQEPVELGDLPADWTGEMVQGPGWYGALLTAPTGERRGWQVLQNGETWLLRLKPLSGAKLAPAQSALLLRDGWLVGQQAAQQPLAVTLAGKRWLVLPSETVSSVAGTVVGSVRLADMAGPRVAKNSVATMVPVAPLLATPSTPPRHAARPTPSVADMLVKIEPAAGLKAVPNPDATAENLPHEDAFKAAGMSKLEAAVAAAEGLKNVYVPGTLVSLTIADTVRPAIPSIGLAESEPAMVAPVVAAPTPTTAAPAAPAEKVATVPTVASMTTATAAPPPAPSRAKEPAEILFPEAHGDYHAAVSAALQLVAESPENSKRLQNARLALAAEYLAWQRPEEALGVLSLLNKDRNQLPVNARARLYMGLALLARQEPVPAELFELKGALSEDGQLWRAVALSAQGNYADALRQWPRTRGVLPKYPPYLRELAQLAQLTALATVGDKATATQLIDEQAAAYASGTVPLALVRLQGLVRLGTKDEPAGLEYLAKVAESPTMGPAAAAAQTYRAKYEFVKALQQRRDLSDAQVRQYLRDLWLDWRGDDLERDILRSLAELYDKEAEPRDALIYWRALVRSFPASADMNQVTNKMTAAFLDIFDPEKPHSFDDLTMLGVYYDFRELIPPDARGDLVQEQVAKTLVEKQLWARAVPILEQQLKFRALEPAAQGRLTLLLAESLRRLGRAGDALKLLDRNRSVVRGQVLERQWRLMESELLLDLQRPVTAAKAAAALPDDASANQLQAQGLWQAGEWVSASQVLGGMLTSVTTAQLTSDTVAQSHLLQLAYALGQQRALEALQALQARFAPALVQLPQVNSNLQVIMAMSGATQPGPANNGPLQGLTTTLQELNAVAAGMDAARQRYATRRAEQQEYNEKMRYLDLLPPPAL